MKNAVLSDLYVDGHRSLVQEGSGQMLHDLVRRERLQRTAEVGLAYGGSAIYICQALAENGGGFHTAVDPFQTTRFERVGVGNVERAGLSEYFRFVEGSSQAVLSEMAAEAPGSLDLVFIDGSHRFDHALVDFYNADLLVRPGGFVAFDDLWMPGVLRVVNYVLRNRDYALVPVDAGRYSTLVQQVGRVLRRLRAAPLRLDGRLRVYGLNTCILQKAADDARPWDYHRAF